MLGRRLCVLGSIAGAPSRVTRQDFSWCCLDFGSLCNLCVLCVSVVNGSISRTHHRDTENTEVAQRLGRRQVTFFDGIRQVTKSDARFTWVKAEFLAAQKVWAWSDMPVWMPAQGEMAGFCQISIQKALGKGLTFRSFSDTTQATLEWIREQPSERQAKLKAGVTAEREAEVLAAWHARRSD